jgi:hypothetical protein
MESKFCPCNPDLFFDLGRQVRDLAEGPSMPASIENSVFDPPIPTQESKAWAVQLERA